MRISDWSSDVCSSDLIFTQLGQPFGANLMDQLPEHFDPRGEPLELLHRDTIVLRIARLHIGVLQLLEPRPVSTRLARPSIDKATNNPRSEEHTSELQSLMRISFAVFCM